MGAGEGHQEGVNGVCFADDDHVLSWSKDRTARYWSLSDGSSVVLSGGSPPVLGRLGCLFTCPSR
jgi:WD40 repeat protein